MQEKIGPNSVITRSTSVIDSDIDGETVMMSLQAGQYFGLEGIGQRIWHLLESENRLQDICRRLMQEYEVSEAQCERDVRAFLTELLEQDIVAVREPA